MSIIPTLTNVEQSAIAEIIHLISIYPLLYDETEEEVEKILKYFNLEHLINKKYLDYLMYCLDAYTPEDRDDNRLRRVSYSNVVDNASVIKNKIKEAMRIGAHCPSIKTIYDIGSGHDGYADVLQEIYPKAKITLIDNFKIENSKYKTRKIKADKFLDNLKPNTSTLLFFSDFMQHKGKSLSLLVHDKASQCCILVNELLTNAFIKYRLQQTDGDIVPVSDVVNHLKLNTSGSEVCIRHSRYETMFPYYMVSYYPLQYVKAKRAPRNSGGKL
jgi:hypothetical protein